MARQRTDAAKEAAEQKITQYLYEAHAFELMLVHTLGAHIAITPAGRYRSGLEAHLEETRDHATRLERHLARRDVKRSLVQSGYGFAQGVLGQALAVTKLPIDMARGTSGEEMLLKNLRDECANEAAEIAKYLMIEQYAREVGDTATERLAASIRADEERMLERLFEQAPRLVADAVAADVDGKSQYSIMRIGAVDGLRSVAGTAARTVSRTAGRAARRSESMRGSSTPSNRPAVRKPAASSSLARQESGSKRTSTSGAKRSTTAKRSAAKKTTAKRGSTGGRSSTKRTASTR